MDRIQVVWVEDGCICCQACVATLPEVFCLRDGRAEVLGAMRRDGLTSHNEDELCALNEDGITHADGIVEAAAGCPVEVIKFSA